jgi:hypothetical protein
MNQRFKRHLSGIALGLLALVPLAHADGAPTDRMVRTRKQGDLPMLDDVSLVLLAGGTPAEAIAARDAAKYAKGGYWTGAQNVGRASMPAYAALDNAAIQRRSALLQTQLKGSHLFWLPVASASVQMQAGDTTTVTMPVTVDGERLRLGDKVSHVCAIGQKVCIQLDNVTVADTVHRASALLPRAALLDQTTLLKNTAEPVYGLVVEVEPKVTKVDGRAILRAKALRGGYVDVTQCVQAVACGVPLEFDSLQGSGAAGWVK